MKSYSIFILGCLFASSFFVSADDHAEPSGNTGAFTTFIVAATDYEAYLETLKSTPGLFESVGPTAAGYCRTLTGQDFRGQMFIWNAYSDVTTALSEFSAYDPEKAPPAIASLREPKYSVAWKPLKAFETLTPGFERVQRVKVSPKNMKAFIQGLIKIEKAIQDAGYGSFQNALFVAMGGGVNEVDTYTLRSVTPDAEAHGKIIDDYFSGASWGSAWPAVAALIDEVQSDNFEECGMLYTAE